MAWTESDLTKLEAAIAKGIRRVSYDGQSVEYGSLDEMLRTRDLMRKELGLARRGPTKRFAVYSSGT